MDTSEPKVALGSPGWFDLLQDTLTTLVEMHAAPDSSFSFCEVWTNSPEGSVGRDEKGRAGWHVRTTGTTCSIAAGEADDVDFKVVLDYEAILPFARRTMKENRAAPPPDVVMEGNPAALPGYVLQDLHDALVPHTA